MRLQVVLRAGNEPGLLAPIDAFSRRAKACLAAVSYLNEDHAVPVLHDQVDLAVPAVVVALQKLQSVCLQVLPGVLFRVPAAGGGPAVQRKTPLSVALLLVVCSSSTGTPSWKLAQRSVRLTRPCVPSDRLPVTP